MLREINITERHSASLVLDLQRESYKIEAEMIGTDAIPPLKETLEELMICGEQFIGYYEGDELAGVIAYKNNLTQLDIHRVIVHPNHFRKGIARKLVTYIESLYEDKEVIVSTGAKNIPAIQLYQKLGFTKTGEQDVGNGIVLAHFQKQK